MKKVMLLAAMLAMVLAVAAPAFAQDATADNGAAAAGGDDNSTQYTDSFNTTEFCNQVQIVVNDIAQGQYGDANAAVLGDESAAAAEVATEMGVSTEQVLNCFVTEQVSLEVAVEGGDDGGDEESAEELPDTGGASLIALGAGALLVAGGLLARRIVR